MADHDRSHASPADRPRARALGLPFPGKTGPLNAITDVAGVTVGATTLIQDGPPVVRTGVTAILPRPADSLLNPVWGGCFALNGNGEMTGTHWIGEAGWFTGPVTITNTLSLGIAHHATIRWMVQRFRERLEANTLWLLPVAAETYDGWLNDICGQHLAEEHVLAAVNRAAPGPVAEGNTGGGTGMIAYGFKGGTGTSSRVVAVDGGEFTVGVLVQANHGLRPWLTVCGVPVGKQMAGGDPWAQERGSVIVVVATDAPLLPVQLKRLARRAAIGIGRGGTPSGNSSGDIFLAFTTANDPGPLPEPPRFAFTALGNDGLDPVFMAVVEAVEEAVVNAMLAAETMTGLHGRTIKAIDAGLLKRLVLAQGETGSV